VDSTGSIQEINLAGAELLGEERQSLIGTSLAGFSEPGNRRVLLAFLRRLLETGDPCTEVFSLTGADGRRSIVRAQGRADPNAGLRHIALVDTTAARQAEHALALSEANYKMLLDHSTDLISRHDAAGVYLYASPSCRRLLGYEPEELIGRSVYGFVHPDDRDTIRASFDGAMPASSVDAVQCRMRHKDGHYTLLEVTSSGVNAAANDGDASIIALSSAIGG
jgi:PAS domain S-box-containing protein